MRWVPAVLVFALLACPAHALPPDPPTPTVEELVANLGHPVFHVREQAQRDLWMRGDDAIPALEHAARSEDLESARRARELLDRFGWGVRHDTPPAILKLVRKFQAGDTRPERCDAVREEAIVELLALGPLGVKIVRAILGKNLPPEARTKLATHVTKLLRREVPLKLFAGKTDEAADLIDLHAVGTTPEGAADFAAFHAIRGSLPAALARAESALRSGRRPADTKLVLTCLYRAAGEWRKARDVSADLPLMPDQVPYKELLLEDEGDWDALADLASGRELNHPDAVRLSLLRLSGRKEKFDEAAQKIRDDVNGFESQTDIMDAAVALFANHKANDATDLLLRKKKNLALLSEVLISRMRYKEALELIGGKDKEAVPVPPSERLEFDLRRARVLMMAGRRDDAVQLFEEVARGLPGQGRRPSFDVSARALVRTELRSGLRDLACEHAALFVPPETEGRAVGPTGESPFELLFPNDALAAEALFVVLRAKKIPGDRAGPTMIRTRDILAGTAGRAAVDQAIAAMRESAGELPNIGTLTSGGSVRLLKARRYLALAIVCRTANRADDAESAFKVAAELTATTNDAAGADGARSWVYGSPDPARVWIEWGEFLADNGRFREAVTVFETGWKLHPDQPLPLFLSGQALATIGDAKEGQRRIALSHWVSLGNERVRGRFLDDLVRRGEGKAIKREIAFILKACWSRDHYFGNVMNQCARGSVLVGDFATAEACAQRSLLVILRHVGVYFVDPSAYLNVPNELLAHRARARLAAGNIDDALTLAREVLAVTPGHLDLVNGMVPELDKLGRKKEADEMFALAWGAYQKMLADYPQSATARHALALLAAHGRRELDKALSYAKAAVAFDPVSPQYREALAEVHFRRGTRDDAIKVMQKLRDEYPRNSLYTRQLVRYRTVGFDSPWPHVVDE